MQALRIQAVVSADHQIHISAPNLPIGSRAEVIVLLESDEAEIPLRFADLIGHGTDTVTLADTVANVRALREDRQE